MSAEKLFAYFYEVPNKHFNAFFEAATGSSEEHPLAGLSAEATEMSATADDSHAKRLASGEGTNSAK